MSNREILAFAASQLNQAIKDVRLERVLGGDINDSYCAIGANEERVFIKTNPNYGVLVSEFGALSRLAKIGANCYPKAYKLVKGETLGLLSLEHHRLVPLNESSAVQAAETLSVMHTLKADEFGWQDNGHIGLSKQINSWRVCWVDFFVSQRLLPQLERATERGLSRSLVKAIESTIVRLNQLIDAQSIQPSLVHGDLWAGNIAYSQTRKSVLLYDPAPYFGDPETDIAMSQLFGRFPADFYQAYRHYHSAPEDVVERTAIYNIYHALNHVNIFGSAYEGLVKSLLSKVGAL